MDESMKALRQAHDAAKFANRKGDMSEREQNTRAAAHFVGDGNPYSRQGTGLSEYLSGLDDESSKQPRAMYAAAVNRSLDQPVISVAAASRVLGHIPQGDESGYITPRQFLQEKANAVGMQFIRQFEATGRPVNDSIVQIAAAATNAAASQTDDVTGVLAGTLITGTPGVNKTADELRALVSAHRPAGPRSAQAHRTESEDAALRKQYGSNAEFMLTENGRRNHEAQRVSDLWSAQDENYLPASGMSQVQRAVGPLLAYPYNALTGNSNRLVGEPWDELAMINRPDGKLEYAAHTFSRGAADEAKQGPVSVFTPEGRAKYGSHDMSTPMGLISATSENQSYPMAFYRQNVGYPIMELGTHIGNYLAGGDSNHLNNIRDLRQAHNRTTPIVPDHVSPEEFYRLGKEVNGSTQQLTGFGSAVLGPKFADAYNATAGRVTGPTERTYLSPAAQSFVETPAELIADPSNLITNSVVPVASGVKHAVVGAATGGMKKAAMSGGSNFVRSLAKAPTRFVDDFVDETVYEGPAINSATAGIGDYISPEQDNLLMGSDNPNSPGFDERVAAASTGARLRQMDAAQRYGELMGKKPTPYRQSPPSTNIPWLLSR